LAFEWSDIRFDADYRVGIQKEEFDYIKMEYKGLKKYMANGL
jgi:hypothetical protein